jgi:glycerol-3-phosphate acyltransferase PlsY
MAESLFIKSLVIFVLCYLIGSIPVAFIIVKVKSKKDITKEGSGNVGTLNSFTVSQSKAIGIAVLIIDLLKGAIPMYIMLHVMNVYYPMIMFGAYGLILGHNFPVWLKFKGGRGLAPSAGIFLVINYFIVIGWCAVWLVVFLVKRKVLISNTIATFSLPLFVLMVSVFDWMVVNEDAFGFSLFYFTVFSIVITIVILSRHTEVFQRIFQKQTQV